MKSNATYIKSNPQVSLESILHVIKSKGLNISQVKENPLYSDLFDEFKNSLSELIDIICHERSIHELINSIAKSYNSTFYSDMKEYDTYFEAVSETYLRLFSVIKKSSGDVNNIGRVRVDTFLDKDPEVFTYTLRSYIRNNILLDLSRKLGAENTRTESDTVFFEGDESIYKVDSVKFNRSQIENSVDIADQIADSITFKDDMQALLDAVIARFTSRKPVAAYIFLCTLNETYDPRKIVTNLKSKNFNDLFHGVLKDLSFTYNLDISCYNTMVYDATKYLSSFRSISDESARARIDRLASQTRKDVQRLPIANVIRSHM